MQGQTDVEGMRIVMLWYNRDNIIAETVCSVIACQGTLQMERTGKKRKHSETKAAASELIEIPSDTLAAVYYLLKSFGQVDVAAADLCPIRIVLVHQIYNVVANKTTVDQQLQLCRQTNVIRTIKVNSGISDLAVVLAKDYDSLCLQAYKERKKKIKADFKKDLEIEDAMKIIKVFKLFSKNILPVCTDLMISRKDLINALKINTLKKETISKMIHELTTLGFLVQKLDSISADTIIYLFSIPKIGVFLTNVEDGRGELLKFISKRPYKEIIKPELTKKFKFKKSALSLEFHLSDALGSGNLKAFDSHYGSKSLLKIPK